MNYQVFCGQGPNPEFLTKWLEKTIDKSTLLTFIAEEPQTVTVTATEGTDQETSEEETKATDDNRKPKVKIKPPSSMMNYQLDLVLEDMCNKESSSLIHATNEKLL
ncbi:hypothetical protein FRB94_014018 [Tulasnella sp. JGI-2019a]|nr:hypothetical protein FRB93_010132 [Tulasnella sp. JGI-2019a]KAG8989779.1 hypothetical protein FRB94_014018 [Tulasnella sp. JGI-2019a]KAG9023371.1 hypothetical protein FRB95_013192 [Tulasnella sp. JGI-2019a]